MQLLWFLKAEPPSPGCGRPGHHVDLGRGFKEFLSKEEAAAAVLMSRKAAGKPIASSYYDIVVQDLVKAGNNGIPKYVSVFQQALDSTPLSLDTTTMGG